MATQTTKTHNEYTVGWVCALPKEQTAATAMLDQRHGSLPKPANDSNTYTLGSIGKHNVVIACLPKGHIGNNSAATVAAQMVSTFPSVRFGLMFGIGGGIPPKVKLGDVVVSTPIGSFPGVVQWDLGKAKDGGFERTGSLNNPPSSLLTAITALETEHDLVGSKIPEYLDEMKQKWPRAAAKYLKSDLMEDVLFKADYNHIDPNTADCNITFTDDEGEEEQESCRLCDKSKAIKRNPRDMRVHYGLIASGNQVIKSATHRDKLNKDLGGRLLCVEMEAAGLMNNFPCLVIRGICDYADSHKNNHWQEYAAAVAAAFAKELLDYVQPSDVDGERTVKDILSEVLTNVSTTRADVSHIKSNLDNEKDLRILEWITSANYGSQHSDFLKRRQPGSGQWLLDSTEYQTWLGTEKQTLFCPGIPGAGKTILTSIVIDHLYSTFKADPTFGIAYIYCNYRRQEEQVIEKLLASLLKQLSQGRNSLPNCVRDVYDQHKGNQTRPSLSEILAALHSVAGTYSRVFIIVDALDECQNSDGCRQMLSTELFNLQGKRHVNLFMTSRFIPEIVGCLEPNITLEIRASTDDIGRYLRGHFEKLPLFIQQNQELQQKIVTEISEAVDGMFLLAQIYLDSLYDKLTPKAIKIALKGFQKPIQGSNQVNRDEILDHAYEQAMLRINGQQSGFKDLANKVLLWIVRANRQLTKTELQHALAVEIDEPGLDEENLPSIQDMVSVCAGLVTVDDESNIIRLVHYTTQEYFNQTWERWFPDANISIAETCVTYLLHTAIERGSIQHNGPISIFERERFVKRRLKSYPLYIYAAQNWGHHARNASKLSYKIMEFLECEEKMGLSIEVLNFPRCELGQMTNLHLAAYFGIKEAVRVLVEKTVDVNAIDDNGETPLGWATRNGHVAVVKLLLAMPSINANSNARYTSNIMYDAVYDDDDMTPLELAVKYGHEDIVKLLLAIPSVTINSDNRFGDTPLSLAAQFGREAVVKLLLEAGAYINHRYKGKIPLFLAVKSSHEAIVKLLLEAGADINITDDYNQTPLFQAALQESEAFVKLLLEAGADINHTDIYNQTPLFQSAGNNNEAVIKLLLAAGADIHHRDESGETPLFIAVANIKDAVTRLLLAAGADPDLRNKHGDTALSRAQRFEKGAIVKLLLDKSTSTHLTDIDGEESRPIPVRSIQTRKYAEIGSKWRRKRKDTHQE